jgi:hypothetical protein
VGGSAVLIGIGVVIFLNGRARARRALRASASAPELR